MQDRTCTVGILAHVDAGKTTLSEALLYRAGAIRSPGRVDRRDTHLDVDPLERERGITILSKTARFTHKGVEFTLLDTPGHTDLSPEAERALPVLDLAVLLISAPDGVQNHTRTLWRMLAAYHVPTMIFVNKTDLPHGGAEALAKELCSQLSPGVLPLYPGEPAETRRERIALCHEDLLQGYTDRGEIDRELLRELVARRQVFPCLFGAALRMDGVDEFLDALVRFSPVPAFSEAFGARVYKIAREGNQRLTFMKITGGELRVRQEIRYSDARGETRCEKVALLRRYDGGRSLPVDSARPGDVVGAVGLSATFAGQGLGDEPEGQSPMIAPVLTYRLRLPEPWDPAAWFARLRPLEEEDPSLRLSWSEELREISVGLMGEVQTEILARRIADRFGVTPVFDNGRVLYCETLAAPTEGMGHFEPLRHYAEVRLLLEPTPPGSGITVDSLCPTDDLPRHWQRLILSYLLEKDHRGVRTGAPLRDVRITLLAGRASVKHTEGGDFFEAAARAVRQGLMSGECLVLEPYYAFRLEVPAAAAGRALTDLDRMGCAYRVEGTGDRTVLTGRGPVAVLQSYAREVTAYSRGTGSFSVTPDGYAPVARQEELVASIGYDPCRDVENPCHSIFCAHGAGYPVPWDQVPAHMHDRGTHRGPLSPEEMLPDPKTIRRDLRLDEEELERLMEHEFGPISRRSYGEARATVNGRPMGQPHRTRALIVDGYNVLFRWESLRALAEQDLGRARDALTDLMKNYVAFTKIRVTLVFDGYRVKGNRGESFSEGGLEVVYTREGQTADAWIERRLFEIGKDYTLRVVTSDGLIQVSAVHTGVLRMSADEFEQEVRRVHGEITAFLQRQSEDARLENHPRVTGEQ